LSVDPLADKYPSMSAFMYCAGNPVKLIDPNGMEIDGIGDGIKSFFKGVGNLLNGRRWGSQSKTDLVSREAQNDVMNARFRGGKFIGWVSNSYLNNLSNRNDATSQNLLRTITNELTYWSPSERVPMFFNSYADVSNYYARQQSFSASMIAPTVKKITGQATLAYADLPQNFQFDLKKGKNLWSFMGPPGVGTHNFNFSKNDILTTAKSRLQPQWGNANTPPLSNYSTTSSGQLFFNNGIFSISATSFRYNLSVPVIR